MDIICLGLIVCDILVKPVTKDLLDRDSTNVEFVKMSSGGDAFNAAVNLAKMGVDTGIAGKVGKDEFGSYLIRTARENSIDTRGVVITQECGTSTSVVLIHPDGERSFAYYGGATDKLREEDIDINFIKEAKILCVGSALAFRELDGKSLGNILAVSHKHGITTVLDVTQVSSKKCMDVLKPALQHTDIFMPSLKEAEILSGKDTPEDMARIFIGLGVKLVVIKMGDKGCFIHSGDESFYIRSFKVNAVDCTGAGDSFVAGFLAGYSKGWPLCECGKFGNAAGALCVRQAGATAGAVPLKQIREFINSQSEI